MQSLHLDSWLPQQPIADCHNKQVGNVFCSVVTWMLRATKACNDFANKCQLFCVCNHITISIHVFAMSSQMLTTINKWPQFCVTHKLTHKKATLVITCEHIYVILDIDYFGIKSFGLLPNMVIEEMGMVFITQLNDVIIRWLNYNIYVTWVYGQWSNTYV